jgi:transglutaminase-like putative cysteine protease
MNFDHADVVRFAHQSVGGAVDPRQQAVLLYYAVRDSILYDPYTIKLTPAALRASTTLRIGRSWCVPKAILMAACCRYFGIPARLGFADVRNHLSTARMREKMQTDIFYWHGYTAVYLNGNWIKATPAFNLTLCEKFHLKPLEFDGHHDSIFHPFDLEGNQHMEYVSFRGEFADVPISAIEKTLTEKHGLLNGWNKADFEAEVEQETDNGSNK